jgi:hypothetical protein
MACANQLNHSESRSTKKAANGDLFNFDSSRKLLDFGFLEIHVLAGNRVVLPLDQFVGHGAAVLFGHIEKAGIRRAFEFDLDGGRFCHFGLPA